jgi:hypothetical protein
MMPTRRTRPVRADGLDRALREGRRRRRRALGAVSAPSAALAVVLAIVLQGSGPGADSLKTLDEPSATSTASPVPESSVEPEASASAEPSPDSGSEGQPAGQQEGEPAPTAEPMCIDYCDPEQYYPVAHRVVTDSHEVVRDTHGSCQMAHSWGNGEEQSPPFCVYLTASATTVSSGTPVQVQADWCVQEPLTSATTPTTLRWGSGQEHDLTVSTSDADFPTPLWSWSTDVIFLGTAHEEPLDALSCVRWTTMWDGTIKGDPAPPGDYDLEAWYVDSPNSYGGGGHVTVTVTD